MSEPGCLIAFEGIEGSGKSTQIKLAAAALRQRGVGVVETREPGGTPLGSEIRRAVMKPRAVPPTPRAELLLYLADREQHLAEVVLPAMGRGEVVLTDRFSASTIAYQGYGRELDVDAVVELDEMVRGVVVPALTLLYDCPVSVGLGRARGSDRFHGEEEAFHARVREGLLIQAREAPERYVVIDATQSAPAVHEQTLSALWARLQNR